MERVTNSTSRLSKPPVGRPSLNKLRGGSAAPLTVQARKLFLKVKGVPIQHPRAARGSGVVLLRCL